MRMVVRTPQIISRTTSLDIRYLDSTRIAAKHITILSQSRTPTAPKSRGELLSFGDVEEERDTEKGMRVKTLSDAAHAARTKRFAHNKPVSLRTFTSLSLAKPAARAQGAGAITRGQITWRGCAFARRGHTASPTLRWEIHAA